MVQFATLIRKTFANFAFRKYWVRRAGLINWTMKIWNCQWETIQCKTASCVTMNDIIKFRLLLFRLRQKCKVRRVAHWYVQCQRCLLAIRHRVWRERGEGRIEVDTSYNQQQRDQAKQQQTNPHHVDFKDFSFIKSKYIWITVAYVRLECSLQIWCALAKIIFSISKFSFCPL